MDAETAYIFRHAVLRDAAYDLQPPDERSMLHALAHDTIVGLFAGRESELDAAAAELAHHAESAAFTRPAYRARECAWLQRAARFAGLGWRGAEAAAFHMRVADHSAASIEEKGQALCGAGKSLIDIGSLQPALAALERALEYASSDTGRLLALRPLSYAYRNVGRNDDALAAAKRIEQIGRSSANPTEQALMLDAIATALMGLERNEEALPVAEQAVAMAERGGNARVLGGMRGNLGVLLGRFGRRDEGTAMLRRAIGDLQGTGDRRAIAAARRNLADQMRANGQPQAAMPECEEALAEMRTLGDKRGEGMAAMTLGGIHRDTGRPLEALNLLEQAADLLADSGDLRAAAICQCNAATAWLDLPDFAACEAAVTRATLLAHRADAPRVLAMALAITADMRRDQERWGQAADLYERAHAQYALVGERRQGAWQLGERAVALRRARDGRASAVWEAALATLRADAPEDVPYYADAWQAAAT